MSFQIKNYTLGSDFELATVREGKIVPALEIEGNKWDPMSIENDCYIQRDGVNAEFNIPPVSSKEDWLRYTNYCFDKGSELLALHGLTLLPSSSHVYDSEQLDQYDLRELGCSESYDAYNNAAVRQIEGAADNMRTCGYHVHIGFNHKCPVSKEKPSKAELCNLAHYFDLYLGVPSVILDPDTERRNMYGKPGDFRFKVIKSQRKQINLFEYRSLGGNLLRSFDMIEWVYDNTLIAIEAFNKQIKLPSLKTLYNTINKSNVAAATKLINKYEIQC